MSNTPHTTTQCSLCYDRGWYIAGVRIYQCKACNRFSTNSEATVFVVSSYANLLAACENTAASLAICQMPRLDTAVATNEQIIATALDGLRAVIAVAKGGET